MSAYSRDLRLRVLAAVDRGIPLGVRFPRRVAWPLAAVGVASGAPGILRAAPPAAQDVVWDPRILPSDVPQNSGGSGKNTR